MTPLLNAVSNGNKIWFSNAAVILAIALNSRVLHSEQGVIPVYTSLFFYLARGVWRGGTGNASQGPGVSYGARGNEG